MAGTEAQFLVGKPTPGQIIVINHTMTDGAAGTDYDQVIALPFDVAILSCYVTVETTLAVHAANYNELAIGDGTQDILNADSATGADNVAFTGDTPRAMIDYDPAHNLIAADGAIHFLKTHAGTPANAMGQIEFTLIVVTV